MCDSGDDDAETKYPSCGDDVPTVYAHVVGTNIGPTIIGPATEESETRDWPDFVRSRAAELFGGAAHKPAKAGSVVVICVNIVHGVTADGRGHDHAYINVVQVSTPAPSRLSRRGGDSNIPIEVANKVLGDRSQAAAATAGGAASPRAGKRDDAGPDASAAAGPRMGAGVRARIAHTRPRARTRLAS